MAIDLTDYFTKMGKLFYYANTTQTALGTTVADEVEDFLQQFTTESIEVKATAEGVANQLSSLQTAGASFLSSSMTSFAGAFLIRTVKDDNPQIADSVSQSRDELRAQMIAQSATLDASSPACTPSYDVSNTGDGVIVISTKRGDGLVNEFIFAEDIEAEVTSVLATGQATFSLTGEVAVANRFSHQWPGGSGATTTLTSHVASGASNLITNGSFATVNSSEADLPTGWIAPTATFGTTLKVSEIEVQTVAISGTPTGGHYLLNYTDAAGDIQTTDPIAYNATSSAVQTALRALTGLESVTVTLNTGTAPNVTHDVTFTGVTNPVQLTSTSFMTGGSPVLTHATTTAASANVVRGARSVEFDSNESELTTIQTKVTLSAATQYAFSCLMKTDSTPALGVFTIDLVDGTNGTVVADDQSVNNSFTVAATGLTTSWAFQTAVFRTPTNMPTTVYLRIRISTAVSSTSSVFLDEVILVPMSGIYTGGVSAALFTGPTAWLVGDKLTLPVTNSRAGALHDWMNRVFNFRENNFLLPTDNSDTETINDSLIA